MAALSINPKTPAKKETDRAPADHPYTPIVGSAILSPADKERIKAAQDEAIVESALNTLLYLPLMRHTHFEVGETVPEWSRQHLRLRFGTRVAITDGCLMAASGKAKAIVEVKPFNRASAPEFIRMQESGQMAAWIKP